MSGDETDADNPGGISAKLQRRMEKSAAYGSWRYRFGIPGGTDEAYAAAYRRGQQTFTDEDSHAVMPPYEKYAKIPAKDRAREFSTTVAPGDLIVGVVTAISDVVMEVKLVAFELPKNRLISDLNLMANLPVTKLLKIREDVPYGYEVGDHVRCEVWRIGQGGVALSMLGEVANTRACVQKPLGKIDGYFDLPLAEWRSKDDGKYEDIVEALSESGNRGAFQLLAEKFGLSLKGDSKAVSLSKSELRALFQAQCVVFAQEMCTKDAPKIEEDLRGVLDLLQEAAEGPVYSRCFGPEVPLAYGAGQTVLDPELGLETLLRLKVKHASMPHLDTRIAWAYVVLGVKRMETNCKEAMEIFHKCFQYVPNWEWAWIGIEEIERRQRELSQAVPQDVPMVADSPDAHDSAVNIQAVGEESSSLPPQSHGRAAEEPEPEPSLGNIQTGRNRQERERPRSRSKRRRDNIEERPRSRSRRRRDSMRDQNERRIGDADSRRRERRPEATSSSRAQPRLSRHKPSFAVPQQRRLRPFSPVDYDIELVQLRRTTFHVKSMDGKLGTHQVFEACEKYQHVRECERSGRDGWKVVFSGEDVVLSALAKHLSRSLHMSINWAGNNTIFYMGPGNAGAGAREPTDSRPHSSHDGRNDEASSASGIQPRDSRAQPPAEERRRKPVRIVLKRATETRNEGHVQPPAPQATPEEETAALLNKVYSVPMIRVDICRDERARRYALKYSISREDCDRWLNCTMEQIETQAKRTKEMVAVFAAGGNDVSDELYNKIKFLAATLEFFPVYRDGKDGYLKEYTADIPDV